MLHLGLAVNDGMTSRSGRTVLFFFSLFSLLCLYEPSTPLVVSGRAAVVVVCTPSQPCAGCSKSALSTCATAPEPKTRDSAHALRKASSAFFLFCECVRPCTLCSDQSFLACVRIVYKVVCGVDHSPHKPKKPPDRAQKRPRRREQATRPALFLARITLPSSAVRSHHIPPIVAALSRLSSAAYSPVSFWHPLPPVVVPNDQPRNTQSVLTSSSVFFFLFFRLPHILLSLYHIAFPTWAPIPLHRSFLLPPQFRHIFA